MYISQIKLQNWKNFQQAEAPLGLRVFVIGANASGKSNLLDAFRFLRDVANDGLAKAVDDARGGVSAIRCLSARRYSDIEIEVQLAENGDDRWSYLLAVSQDSLRRPVVKREIVLQGDHELLRRPNTRRRASILSG